VESSTLGKASVIIPVYKTEKYVKAAVASVLNQTYENFEIIVVDDGSPDDSLKLVRQFDDPRIRIIEQENRGLAGARNTGIRHAVGEYIAFLDSDDVWVPEKLAKHVKHLETCPSVGVSFSPSALIDERGNALGTFLKPKLKDITLNDLLRCNVVGNGSAALVRKTVLNDVSFQNIVCGETESSFFYEKLRRNEDYELWLRIAIKTSWIIEGIVEPLTLYRVNPNGLSSSFLKQLEAWEQVLAYVCGYAPDVMAQQGKLAMAYHLRYLARTAIRLQRGLEASSFINMALSTYWLILLEEPLRTLSIFFAAYTLKFQQCFLFKGYKN
jgi:glycosyltransferase involved in cell wall biosynthesis